MSLLRRVDRFVMDVAPPERLGVLRLIVGGYALVYLAIRTPHLLSYADYPLAMWQPVGVASFAAGPLVPAVATVLVFATVALAVPFVLGWRYRVLAPLFAGLLLWVLTYSNSWGKILHTDNLLVLHVGILALCPAADAVSLDARRRADAAPPEPDGRYGWAIRLMCAVCIATYLLAGIAKVVNSGFAFVDGDTLRNYVAFDNVRKLELGSIHSPLGATLVTWGAPFGFLAALSLVLELGAPLALAHRRIASSWVALVWGFHVGVLALMAIGFAYQLSAVAFAPFFRVERLLDTRLGKRLSQEGLSLSRRGKRATARASSSGRKNAG